MQIYIERRPKRQLRKTLEDSGSHHLKGGTHLSEGTNERPTLTGAATRGQRPITFVLVDPASTDFED